MGYYTKYKLTVTGDYNKVAKAIEDKNAPERIKIALGNYSDSMKWYDYNEDVWKYSKKHPEVLFTLTGEGEDSGDLWIMWTKNGKQIRKVVEIIWPTLNEDELE